MQSFTDVDLPLLKDFKNALGLDYAANMACSKIYQSIYEIFKAIAQMQPKMREILKNENAKPFPQQEEEQVMLKEIQFLIQNERVLRSTIEVDDLAQQVFFPLISSLLKTVEFWHIRQLSINKKAIEEKKAEKKDFLLNERVILISNEHVNLFLRLIFILHDIRYQGKKQSFSYNLTQNSLESARWYEDLEMVINTISIKRSMFFKDKRTDRARLIQLFMMSEELAPNTTLLSKLASDKLICADLAYTLLPLEDKKEDPKQINMSHADLIANQLGAKDLAKNLLFQNGATEDQVRKMPRRHDHARLEMKIIWLRSVVDKPSLQKAIKLQLQIHTLIQRDEVTLSSQEPKSEYSKLFEKVTTGSLNIIKETLEVVKECSNTEIVQKGLQLVYAHFIGSDKQKPNLSELVRPITENEDFEGTIWYRFAKQITSIKKRIACSQMEVEPTSAFENVITTDNHQQDHNEEVINTADTTWTSRTHSEEMRLQAAKKRHESAFKLIQDLNLKVSYEDEQLDQDLPVNKLALDSSFAIQQLVLDVLNLLEFNRFRDNLIAELEGDEDHINILQKLKTGIKELMINNIENGTEKLDQITYFRVQPQQIRNMIDSYLKFDWVADQAHPENFKRVEDIFLKYTLDLVDSKTLVYAEPDGEISIETEHCIVNPMWISKICDGLNKNMTGDTRQLLQGNSGRRMGAAMMNSRVLTLLRERVLSFNNESHGHIFDMFISFYLCCVIATFKADQKNILRLMRSPNTEVSPESTEFIWDEDGLIPIIIKSLKKRMPWNDRFSVNTVITFCLETCNHKDHKKEILQKVETGNVKYGDLSMSHFYAGLFDLIKDQARYIYFQDDFVYMKLVELSAQFNDIYQKTITNLTETILEDTGKMVDKYQDLALTFCVEKKTNFKEEKKNFTKEAFAQAPRIQQDLQLLQQLVPNVHHIEESKMNKHNMAPFQTDHFNKVLQSFIHMIQFSPLTSPETTQLITILKGFNQRLNYIAQINREVVPEYNDSHEKFFFQKIKRCLESFQCTFDQKLNDTSDLSKLYNKPHKMTIWAFDNAELSALMKLVVQVFDNNQILKLTCMENWSEFSDIIFFQPLMLRNERTNLEMEILLGETERAQLLAKDLESEIKAIKNMDAPYENTEEKPKQKNERQKALEKGIKALREKVSDHLENHYCWSTSMQSDQDNYALLTKVLQQISKRQEGLQRQRLAGLSVEENEKANKKFTSEELVNMISSLQTKPEQVNSYTKNGNILAIYNFLDENGKMSCSAHSLLPLICKGGLTKICQLYNYLLQQESIKQGEENTDQNIITWQRRQHLKIISNILCNLIELKGMEAKVNRDSFDECKITEESAPYHFTSLQHFFVNYFNYLLEQLLEWKSPDKLTQKLFQMAGQSAEKQVYWKPMLKLLEIVYIQKFESCPQMRDDYVPDRPGRGHGDRRPSNEARPPARDPSADEIAQVSALGFSEYMARQSLRMCNLDVSRAIDALLGNEAAIYQFIEVENEKNKKVEDEKRKQAEIEKNQESNQLIKVISNEHFKKCTTEFELMFITSHINACRQQIVTDDNWFMLPQSAPKENLALTQAWAMELFKQMYVKEKALKKLEPEQKDKMVEFFKQQLVCVIHAQLQTVKQIEITTGDDDNNQELIMKNLQQLQLTLKLTTQQLMHSPTFKELILDNNTSLITEMTEAINSMSTLLLQMDQINMDVDEEDEKNKDMKTKIKREALVLQTGSVIFESFCFCIEFTRNILSQCETLHAEKKDPFKFFEQSVQPKQLVEGVQKILEFQVLAIPLKEVTEMIMLTKKLALLILNRIITFKYWPESWEDWKYQVTVKSIEFQPQPGTQQKQEKTLLAKLVQNQMALSLYNKEQCMEIFEDLLSKTVGAVSDDHVRELESLGKEVPKVKPTLEEMNPTRIDNSTSELPYEGLFKYFAFVAKNHPSNRSIQDSLSEVILQNCNILKTASNAQKDMKIRLKQDLLDQHKEMAKQSRQKLTEIQDMVRNSFTQKETQENLQKLFIESRNNLKGKVKPYQEEALVKAISIVENQVGEVLKEIVDQDPSSSNYKLSSYNGLLMVRISEVVKAYPHLIPIISQHKESFTKWFVNDFVTVGLEVALNSQVTPNVKEMDQGIEEMQLTTILSSLTGFNRLMGIDEAQSKIELRMNLILEAIGLLRAQLPLVEEAFKENKVNYIVLLKVFSALQIIQTLINDRNSYEYNRVLTDKENFSLSIAVLLHNGRNENHISFVQLIARLVRCMVLSQKPLVPQDEDNINKEAYLQNTVISISIACLTSICNFVKTENRIADGKKKSDKRKSVLESIPQDIIMEQLPLAPAQINEDNEQIQVIQVENAANLVQELNLGGNAEQIQINLPEGDEEEDDGEGSDENSGGEDEEQDDGDEDEEMQSENDSVPYDEEEDDNDPPDDDDDDDDMSDENNPFLQMAANIDPITGRARQQRQALPNDIVNEYQAESGSGGRDYQDLLWDIGRQIPNNPFDRPGRGARNQPEFNEKWSMEECQAQRVLTCLRKLRDQKTELTQLPEEDILRFQQDPDRNGIQGLFNFFSPIVTSEIVQLCKILHTEFHKRLDRFSNDFAQMNTVENNLNNTNLSPVFAARLFDLEQPTNPLFNNHPARYLDQFNFMRREGLDENFHQHRMNFLNQIMREEREGGRAIVFGDNQRIAFGQPPWMRQAQEDREQQQLDFEATQERALMNAEAGVQRDNIANLQAAVFQQAENAGQVELSVQAPEAEQPRLERRRSSAPLNAAEDENSPAVNQEPNQNNSDPSILNNNQQQPLLNFYQPGQQPAQPQPRPAPGGGGPFDLGAILASVDNSILQPPQVQPNQLSAANMAGLFAGLNAPNNANEDANENANENQDVNVNENQPMVNENANANENANENQEAAENANVSVNENIAQPSEPEQPPTTAVVQEPAQEEMHFGIPLSILQAHDIDVEVLYMLPEDMRAEQLSMVDLSAIQAQPAQDPPAENNNPPAQEVLASQNSNVEMVQENQAQPQPNAQPEVSAFAEFVQNEPAQEQPAQAQPAEGEAQPEAEGQPQLEQQPAQENQPNAEPVPVEEEKLDEVQPAQAEAPQLNEQGFDQAFLESLPEEMRAEILANAASFQAVPNQPVNAQPAELDLATLIATTQDPGARRDMLVTLNEAQIQTLPQNLRIEAENERRNVAEARANEQNRIQDMLEAEMARVAGRHGRHGHPPPQALFGAHGGLDRFGPRRGLGRHQSPEEQLMLKITKALVNSIGYFQDGEEKAEDQEFVEKIEQEIIQHEPLLESLILILLKTKDSLVRNTDSPSYNTSASSMTHCRLLQLLGLLSSLKSPTNKFAMQNKLINALILQLQLEIENNPSFKDKLLDISTEAQIVVEQLQENQSEDDNMVIDTTTAGINKQKEQQTKKAANKKQKAEEEDSLVSILTLIGAIRILQSTNKKIILNGLNSLLKGDDYFEKKGSTVMIKQAEVNKELDVKNKSPLLEVLKILQTQQNALKEIPINSQESTSQDQKMAQHKRRVINRNLQPIIQENFKDFSKVLEKLQKENEEPKKSQSSFITTIKEETITAMVEILNLSQIDTKLVDVLSQFMLQISDKNEKNWALVRSYCEKLGQDSLKVVNSRIQEAMNELKKEEDLTDKPDVVMEEDLDEEELEAELKLVKKFSTPGQSPAKFELIRRATNEMKEAVQDFELTKDQELAIKKQLTASTEDLQSVVNIFRMYSQFQLKLADTKGEESPSLIKNQIEGFYMSREVRLYLIKLNDLLGIMQKVKQFGKPSSEKSKTLQEIEKQVTYHLQCIFSSVENDLKKMDGKLEETKEEEKKNEPLVKMCSLDTKKSTHKILDLFKNANVDQISERLEEFGTFCLNNKKIINKLMLASAAPREQPRERRRQQPEPIPEETGLNLKMKEIVRYMPHLLDFENKRAYFNQELKKQKQDAGAARRLRVKVDRDNIFMESFAQLNTLSVRDIRAPIEITFKGEAGIDAGGVSRDYFIKLSQEMFNPNFALFSLTDNGVSFHPNGNSYTNPDHLQFFRFVGRIVGKAIYEGMLLECHFSKPFYKMILGEDLAFEDLESLDNDIHKNLTWYLENDVSQMYAYFAISTDYFGKEQEIELIPGGKDIEVTNQNVKEYVEKLSFFHMHEKVKDQIRNFLAGFHELIPKNLISIFNPNELELLIAGLPNFDIEDMKANTDYEGFNENSEQIMWFWEIIAAFDSSEIGLLLQFSTGSSRIPLDGFKSLQGMHGMQRFSIKKLRSNDMMRLPAGHTCFNQLDMPEYPSREIMHERLLWAIKETAGFGQV